MSYLLLLNLISLKSMIIPGLRELNKLVLVLIFAVRVSYSGAQIVMTPSTGCATLAVQFSGPSNATNVVWTIGSKTTNVVNPSENFQAGTYQIVFNGIVGGNPVSYTETLVVKPVPAGAFSFTMPASRCAPATVTMSGSGGSPGSTYNWSFGDLSPLGNGSLQQHTYSAGSFVPAMTIVDAVTGCTAVATNQSGTVHVSSPPNLVVTANPGLSACSNTLVTSLSTSASTSGSPLGGGLSGVSWTLTNGSPPTATGINIGPVTWGPGQHPVIVKASDNNFCSSTTTVYASAGAPYLNVPASTTMCIGDTIMPVVISSESSFIYTMPGRSPVVLNNNILMYYGNSDTLDYGGSYVFTVTVNPAFPCAAITKTFEIFSEYFTPHVTVSNPTSACQPSLILTVTAQSSVNTNTSINYSWTIKPHGLTSSVTPSSQSGQVATFTIFQGYHPNPYYVYPLSQPLITMYMKSSSVAQCTASAGYNGLGVVQRPSAWFYTDKTQGCAPLEVGFRDSTFTHPLHPVTSYTFYSGESPPNPVSGTGTVSPFTHTYSAPGTYSAYMIVTTSVGCIDTSFYHVIKVGSERTATLSLAQNSICAGESVQLNVGLSPPDTSVKHYHVHSDNGMLSHCINDTMPQWGFMHTGTHGFSISAVDNGCVGGSVPTESISVNGPWGSMRLQGSCIPGQRKTVNFHCYLQDVSSAVLNFGDGSSFTLTANPGGVSSHTVTHTYSVSADYIASLTSLNPATGCSPHTFTCVVKVRDIKAHITYNGKPVPALPEALGCVGLNLTFKGDSSVDEEASCERGYIWWLRRGAYQYKVVDYSSPVFTSTILTQDTIYDLMLQVKDVNGCVDTARTKFRLTKGYADFTFSSNPICISNGTVQLNQNSLALMHPADTIKFIKWDFGDNTTYTTTNVLDNPIHQYASATSPSQVYLVSLETTNQLGCVATKNQFLQVNNPVPNLQVSNYYPCIPKGGAKQLTFYGSPGYATYSLNPGLPNSSWINTGTQNSLSVIVNTTGVFTPTMVIFDQVGCTSKESITVTAIGQPTASIAFGENQNKFCLPGTPTLISTSLEYDTPITYTLWSMANNTTPIPGTGTFVNHIFTSPGTHTISLQVSHDYLCPSTATAIVIVADPLAELNLNKDKFCLNDTIKVSLRDTSGVEGWRWFYGDFTPQNDILSGSLFAIQNPTLSYPYKIFPSDSTGKTEVTLRYYGTAGACVRTISKPITVIQLHASMVHVDNVYRHCLGPQDNFSASTPDHWQLSLNYNWTFGDGSNGTGKVVSHRYMAPGTYSVRVTISDSQFGCKDTAGKVMEILPLPSASLHIAGDLHCPGDSVLIFGKGVPGISGSLTGTLSPYFPVIFDSANQFTVPVFAQQTTTFGLLVTDENNCVSHPALAEYNVMPAPPSRNWDTVIVLGQTLQLNGYAGSNFTYSWNPPGELSCDTCYNPVSTTSVSATYTLLVTDHPLQCYNTPHLFRVIVKPVVSLDVPTAFTPNGDGINDVIYPDGWGLKKLLYFRVYNRWGQLIFESNDLSVGWDGRYNGVLQNIETYVYQVAAETLLDTVLTKTGSFKLLR